MLTLQNVYFQELSIVDGEIFEKGSVVKFFAGVWIASLPKEMEGRSILRVEFLSPKVIDMKIWKPTFSLARYTPESLLFKRRITESLVEDFHLARTQVEISSMDKLTLIN